jgi:uncharacterized protein
VVERVVAALIGVVFGLTLSWTALTNPDTIGSGLLFENLYLILFFASAVIVAFVGSQILRRLHPRALLNRERVEWKIERPERRHLTGAVLFGTGWAIAGACPGPIAAQLGSGVWWSLFTLVGVVIGVVAFLRIEARRRADAPDGSRGGEPGETAEPSPQTDRAHRPRRQARAPERPRSVPRAGGLTESPG